MPACESRPTPDPRDGLEHAGAAGTVLSADLTTDELFLRVDPTRSGSTNARTMVFKIEPETEVFIDDALRELSEVKVGDKAKIVSYLDPMSEGSNIAVAVVIQREQPPLPEPDWMNPNTRAARTAEPAEAANETSAQE